ncbi:MAG TPA: twin-arginine translocation signal domain-containing protein [Terrimicrobiaceae bacterium]
MQHRPTRRDFLKGAAVTAATVALPRRASASSEELTSGESLITSWLAKQFTPSDDGRALSNPHSGADAGKGWLPAVVPGTVLTTLPMNGVTPDPYFGLNSYQISNVSRMADTLAC